MKLTQLEVKGFKSFAEHTIINFNERITGIVGPNGCGKSNVVDAIRWVLGEQKPSMLRIEKMENLIFNGTKNRKASGLAEVSLTFENTNNVLPTEYKTVTITRKLFRDGESEYRLNDVSCRLKDISNLFMDTGISADSYAIIELGRVDEILNDRENSRRRLFEQASGISKYKSRKKETLLKLKGTEGDLDRVKDLLFEIEGNLKTLESQAKRTQKYYALKQQYKELSIELAKLNLQSHKNKYNNLKVSLTKEEDNKIEIEKNVAKAEADLEKEKLVNLDFEKALSEIQKNLNMLLSGVSAKENDRNLLQQQLQFEIQRNDSTSKSIKEAHDKIENLKSETASLYEKSQEEEATLLIIQEATDELKGLYEAAKSQQDLLKSTLDNQQRDYAEKERQIVDFEKKTAVNKANKENLQKQLEQNKQESLFKNDELRDLQTQFENIDGKKNALDEKIEQLIEDDKKTQDQITNTEAELAKLQQDLIKENRTIDSKQNEYNLTKSLVENLEGFPEAVKFLKKNAKWTKDAPLLSDIIYCSEEYRICIENYLEPYLNYYVVESFDDAFMAVNLLNDSAKGRANFFVLDAFKNYKKIPTTNIEGAIPANKIVELDEKYSSLASHLLHNVYLVDETGNLDIKSSIEKDIVLLAKSGKYVKGNYNVSGGSVGLFEGKKIGRAKNLEKLEKEIAKHTQTSKELSIQLDKFQDQIAKLKSSFKKSDIDMTRAELNQINNQYTALKTRIESLNSFILSADSKLKELSDKITAIDNEDNDIQAQLVVLKDTQNELKEILEKQDSDFVELNTKTSELSVNFNQKNIAFHQQSNRVNTLSQDYKYKSNQLNDLLEQLDKNKNIVSESSTNINDTRSKLKAMEDELLAGYEDRELIKAKLESAEQNYYKSKSKINELDNTVREVNKNKNLCEQSLLQFKDKMNDMRIDLSSIKERLSIEFNVDINEVLNQEPNPELQIDELTEKVTDLKSKIDKFGEINPMALEAYDEMKIRYDFIIAQKTDLENSKQTLMDTINEIESTAKTKFMDSFNSVRENFIRVFKTLFNEDDTADLILLNPEDPLESKIDIIAKPKGKRPQIIDQLSGGEKTLTATALLFSLYLLKPAPFCIFDEVDAPLDDANISKFNNIIRDFSNESQFIIVTHNKSTMSHVDVMYGVVMAELGVSQVAPVDFRNWN
jgi:chromosome segregation protein